MKQNQSEITNLSFTYLNDIKSATNGVDSQIAFCAENGTLYRYLTTGQALIPNNTTVLITGDGGFSRWVGIGGTYSYTQYTTKEYGYFTMSADQTSGFAINNPVKFDTQTIGNMTFDAPNYKVLLKANVTYSLIAAVIGAGATDAVCEIFRDVTNGVNFGNIGYALSTNFNNNATPQQVVKAMIKPTTDIYVSLVHAAAIGLTSLVKIYCFMEIQSIEAAIPVVANLGQFAYVSPQVDLTVSGTNWTKIRARGVFYKTPDGVWYLKGNISGSVTGAPATLVLTIAGVVFNSTSANYVGVSVVDATNKNAYMSGYPNSNAATITMYNNVGWKDCGCSFDLELNSKPVGYGIPSSI